MTKPPDSGKQLPSRENVKKIISHIFKTGSDSFTYTLKNPDLRIHYVARYKYILELLRGPSRKKINLSQYNHLVSTCTRHTGFLLGENDTDTDTRWDILRLAMEVKPKLDRHSIRQFEIIGNKNTRRVVNFLLERTNQTGQFNAVREYGYLIGYLSAVDFFGIAPPKKPSLILRFIIFIRNLLLPGRIRLKGYMVGASAFLLWTQFMAPHLFGNLGNRNKLLRGMARFAAKRFEKQIVRSLAHTHNPPFGSLIHRLKSVRSEFHKLTDTEYEKLVVSILLEMVGEVVMLPGQAFAHILDKINDLKITPKQFLDLIDKHGDIVIDEALRLNPTTGMLFRMVKEEFTIGNTQLKPGDAVCLILAAAGNDPRVFEKPAEFAFAHTPPLKRDWENYLNFGVNEAGKPHNFRTGDDYHPCFGQYWARTLIKAMLEGLVNFPELTFPEGEK